MSWYDALPGSKFTVRQASTDDVDAIVGDMTTAQFVEHFETDDSYADAISKGRAMLRKCWSPLLMEADGPVYLTALWPMPRDYGVNFILWGLPSRKIGQHAAGIAHWCRRRLLPHLESVGFLPVATANVERAMDARWLKACGAVQRQINDTPLLVWEA